MDWTAAFAFQREHVRTRINRYMKLNAGKVGQDGEITIDQIFSIRSLFEDFLWSWNNGLIHMQLPIDKRVNSSKTTPCHIKIFPGVLPKDVRNIAYQVGFSLFFALESYFRFCGHYSRTMLAK